MNEFLESVKNTPEFKVLFALFLGFIIGLEREVRAKFGHDIFAGVRTFPLISVLGTISGLLYLKTLSDYLLIFTFLSLSLLATLSYWKDKSMGITTEVASFITFFIGIFVAFGEFYLSVFLTILTTFVLVLKHKLERIARLMEEEDIIAVLKFFTVSAVILPILPDKEVIKGLNPSEVWKFVILVSTVDFIGYFLLKYKGSKSLLLTGVIGGLTSSTAVTMAFSSLSARFPQFSSLVFFGIILSWSTMFLRVVFYTAVIFHKLTPFVLLILLPYFLILFLFSLYLFLKGEKEAKTEKEVPLKNPYTLTQALTFGVFYSVISVISVYLEEFFGDKGIYILSFISGIMDVDAITLLLSNMAKGGNVELLVASTGIILAVISNNLFKSAYGIAFGSRKLKIYFSLVLMFTFLYLFLITSLSILLERLHIIS
ncbi:MgtC/SapB family protein [Aquifex sp.]